MFSKKTKRCGSGLTILMGLQECSKKWDDTQYTIADTGLAASVGYWVFFSFSNFTVVLYNCNKACLPMALWSWSREEIHPSIHPIHPYAKMIGVLLT